VDVKKSEDTKQSGIQLAKLITIIENLYPPILAESWDSIGLTVGDPHQVISKVLLAVDPVCTVVDQAIQIGADLIFTHHPLFLKPVHSVAAHTFKGDVVHQLTRHGIALFNAHTNADSAPRGVAEALADLIGLRNLKPLVPNPSSSGTANIPMYTVNHGIGRVGDLPNSMPLGEFAQMVVDRLPRTAQTARVAGDLSAPVRRVAVVGGAGDSLFDAVRQQDVDVYLTADLRHHPASEAREQASFESRCWPGHAKAHAPFLVDVSHFASEWPWLKYAAEDIAAACRAAGEPVPQFVVSRRNTDPWTAVIGFDGPIIVNNEE